MAFGDLDHGSALGATLAGRQILTRADVRRLAAGGWRLAAGDWRLATGGATSLSGGTIFFTTSAGRIITSGQ